MTILRNDQENSYEYFEEVCNLTNKFLNKKDLAGIEEKFPFIGATVFLDGEKCISLYVDNDNRLALYIGRPPSSLAVVPLFRYMNAKDAANTLAVAYHSATI